MDISFAMEAKSDQLNAVDIMGLERVIKITQVNVNQSEQPVSIYFEGDHGRPWKPSKGMIRVLGGAWGTDSGAWVGRSVQIYFDETVVYAGQAVGGIRIRALSHIPEKGLMFMQTINRKKREPYPVKFLDTKRPMYPADKFDAALPAMAKKMRDGEMTLQQVIGRCQQTGDLTPEQMQKLQDAAPVEINDNDEGIE